MPETMKRTNIYLKRDQHKKLIAEAKKQDVYMAKIVRKAVDMYLNYLTIKLSYKKESL